jgi:hypothetical protein
MFDIGAGAQFRPTFAAGLSNVRWSKSRAQTAASQAASNNNAPRIKFAPNSVGANYITIANNVMNYSARALSIEYSGFTFAADATTNQLSGQISLGRFTKRQSPVKRTRGRRKCWWMSPIISANNARCMNTRESALEMGAHVCVLIIPDRVWEQNYLRSVLFFLLPYQRERFAIIPEVWPSEGCRCSLIAILCAH